VLVLYAALLGTIQGLTEFLPISSSAHLILARAFFGWDSERLGLPFDVACHVGTLLAIVTYYRAELLVLATRLPRVLQRDPDPSVRLLWLLAAGTAPIVIVGVLFADLIETTLRTPGVAAAMLAGGAALLLVAERVGRRARADDSLTLAEGVGLGMAQAAALVPGVSRSGATIATGMLFGLRRDAAARFAFLLGVPAIVAAAAREALALGMGQAALEPEAATLLAVGLVTSAIVGYLTVTYFIRYLAGHALDLFALYRLALAAVTVVWLWS
jgi:undecaprenyl-diphosphatase